VQAVLGEFGQALAQERADQILGSREVGLQNRQLQVEARVCRRVPGPVG
jgi:hypothetical protein